MIEYKAIDEAVIGKYCIVRGTHFGVFAGTVAKVEGNKALLWNARRLWYWEGAADLTQIALEGVKSPDSCKFTVRVGSVVLLDVIEIIPTTEAARVCIEEVPEWKK